MQVPQKLLACAFVLVVLSSSRADEESKRRFLSEAPASWREVMRLSQGKQFTRESTHQEIYNGLNVATHKGVETLHWFGDSVRIEGVINLDRAKGGAQTLAEAKKDRVKTTSDYAAILNPDYKASLGVKPIPRLSQVVSWNSPEFQVSRMGMLEKLFPGLALRDTILPYAIVDLPEFVAGESGFGLRVRDVQLVSGEGKEPLMRVTFDAHSEGTAISDSYRSGFRAHVDLLPERHWVLQTFHLEENFSDEEIKFVVTRSCQYDGSSWHPTTVHYQESSNEGNNQSSRSSGEIKFSVLPRQHTCPEHCRGHWRGEYNRLP